MVQLILNALGPKYPGWGGEASEIAGRYHLQVPMEGGYSGSQHGPSNTYFVLHIAS